MRRDPQKTAIVGFVGFLVFTMFGYWHIGLLWLVLCLALAWREKLA